jgi:hypothetical protein
MEIFCPALVAFFFRHVKRGEIKMLRSRGWAPGARKTLAVDTKNMAKHPLQEKITPSGGCCSLFNVKPEKCLKINVHGNENLCKFILEESMNYELWRHLHNFITNVTAHHNIFASSIGETCS